MQPNQFHQRRTAAASETAQTNRDSSPPELPSLEHTSQRLVVENKRRPTTILQSLVLDHALTTSGTVVWLDAANHANAASLTRLSPSRRPLTRMSVARAFTPYQHFELATTLRAELEESKTSLSLLVCPALDALYATDEVSETTGKTLLARAMAVLKQIAREYNASLLVTHMGDPQTSPYAKTVASAVPETLRCEQTRFGPRFTGSNFETLVYPDSMGMQTTLAYWQEILAHRASAVGIAVESSSVTPTLGVTANGPQ